MENYFTKITFIAFIIILMSATISLDAEEIPFEKLSSYEGLHFMVGFMSNEWRVLNPQIGVEQKLFITSLKTAKVTVTLPNRPPQVYTVEPDNVQIIPISGIYENKNSEVVRKLGIELVSDVPITIYAFSSQPRTSDSYSAIPISNWGNEYVVVSVPNDQYAPVNPPQTPGDSLETYTPRRSQFMLIAGYDNTVVEFTPTTVTDSGVQKGQKAEVTLQKGEVYLVKSYGIGKGGGDLSGTYVKSNKPVGVLSGHERAAVPVGLPGPWDSKDHLITMLQPVKSWGKQYFSVPFGVTEKGDYFKVFSRTPGTKFTVYTQTTEVEYTINDITTPIIINGLNRPAYWVSNHPIQIAQFMMRAVEEEYYEHYDPCLLTLSPYEQYVNRVFFHTPGNVFYTDNQFESHYINVIAEKTALDDLRLNGALVRNISDISIQTFPNVDLHWAKIELTNGTHELKSQQGKISGVIFGTGRFDSYGMVIGAALHDPTKNDEYPPTLTVSKDCFVLDGVISDDMSQDSFGIHYAIVVRDSTNNFGWIIEPHEPNDTEIRFKAWVLDSTQNGRFMIDFYDKNGNARRYIYIHKAVKLNIPQLVNFPDSDWKNIRCQNFSFTNQGDEALYLNELFFQTDSRLYFEPQFSLPRYILPGETINTQICFNPQGDSTNIDATIVMKFECNINYNLPIKGNVEAADIEVIGYNFGSIVLGEKVCHHAKVINTGNIEMDITDIINLNENNAFDLDLSELVKNLQPGNDNEYIIPVCFEPNARGHFIVEFEAVNSLNLPNSFTLEGIALAPEILSIEYDWGPHRVGTRSEASLAFENIGDTSAVLSFNNFQSKTYDDETSETLSQINNIEIAKNGSYPIDISFEPIQSGDYNIIAEFEVDWEKHERVLVNITGMGLLPDIVTNDVYLPDTRIYDIYQTDEIIFNTGGNEPLYIKESHIIEGDDDIILVDLSLLEDISLEPGNQFSIPITFQPEYKGDYYLKIGIVNDAMPNYELRTDTVTIYGRAIDPVEINSSITFENGSYRACVTSNAVLTISNLNDTPIDLTGIEFETLFTGEEFVLNIVQNELVNSITAVEPYRMSAFEQLTIDLEITPYINSKGTIVAYIDFFDNENFRKTEQIEIEAINNYIAMESIPLAELEPGINKTISLEGDFYDEVTSVYHNLEFEIFVTPELMKIIEESAKFIVFLNGGSVPVQLEVYQSLESILIKTLNMPLSAKRWSLQFDVKPFLTSPQQSELDVVLKSNRCYIGLESIMNTEIVNVCAYDLRLVKINPSLHDFRVYPNPAAQNLDFQIYNPENGTINLHLYDILGNKIQIFKDLFLKKGYHSLNYIIEDVPNGVYNLKLDIQDIEDNRLIIINK